MIRLYLSCSILIILLSGKARAVEPLEESIQPFLSSYCLSCHGANVQKADRRFDQLQFEALGLPDAEHFQEIVDQLNLGTMPPEGETRPPAEEVKRIVSLLTNTLNKFRENSNAGSGDVVRQDAKQLKLELGNEDQDKLEQYLTAIREVERKLHRRHEWLEIPKPKVSPAVIRGDDRADTAVDLDYPYNISVMYDLMVLALQTDSTNVISFGHP